MPAQRSAQPPPTPTLVGANEETVTVPVDAAAATSLRLKPERLQGEESVGGGAGRVILNLENVRGTAPSGVLNVRIGTRDTAEESPALTKAVALFGLARATEPDGSHGGSGISIALDITDAALELARGAGGGLDRLEVRLDQPGAGAGAEPITVERISIYRQPAE